MSGRRLRSRFTTPPRDLIPPEGQTTPQLTTPMRSAIFAVTYYCEQRRIPCSLKDVHEVFGYSSSTASDVLKSKRCRRLQHTDILDPRGRRKPPVNAAGNLNGAPVDNQNITPHEENFSSQSNTVDLPRVFSQSDGVCPPQVLSQSDTVGPPTASRVITTHSVPQRNQQSTITPRKPSRNSKVVKAVNSRKPTTAIFTSEQQRFSELEAPAGSPGNEGKTKIRERNTSGIENLDKPCKFDEHYPINNERDNGSNQ